MKNLKLKDKLLLLICVPLLALLFLSIIVSFDRYKLLEKSTSLNKIVISSSKVTELIFELQKERGVASAYLENQNDIFKDKFTRQSNSTDNMHTMLDNSLNNLSIQVYGSALRKSVDDSLKKMKQIKDIRSKILTQKISHEELIEFYSNIISGFLEIIRKSSEFSPSVDIARQLNAHANLLFTLESMDIEQSVGVVIFSSKKSVPKMQVKFQDMISSQKTYLHTFTQLANENTLKYYTKIVHGKEIDEINRMRKTLQMDMKKKEIMSKMSKQVGYGGIIHNFKNYLIRSDDRYKYILKKQHITLNALINEYKNLGMMSKSEQGALNTIFSTFEQYSKNVEVISVEVQANNNHYNTISLIDEIISIDDQPAINALIELSTYSFFSDSSKYWFDMSSTKVVLFQQVDNYIASNILKQTETLSSLAKKDMIMYLTLCLLILVVVYILSQRVINNINKDIKELSLGIDSFFKYINQEKSEIKLIEINSTDEIGMISKVINEKIITSKKIIDDNIIEKAEQLELLAHHLEVEVKAKTKELQLFNLELENKVKMGIEENRKKDEILAHQSKLAAMGEMMGNIAHQWRQPLNALAGNIQFLIDDYEDDVIDEAFVHKFIHENMAFINFMSKTIDDFRNFFTVNKLKEDFSVIEYVSKTVNIVKPQLHILGITLSTTGDDFTVNGLEGEFQQVILNIINNAKDAIVQKSIKDGKISIQISREKSMGIISICDNAGGIPKEVINRVLEPYFTTKEEGKGTGIGLYMSKMIIVDNMQGELNVSNTKEGACFEIKVKTVDKELV